MSKKITSINKHIYDQICEEHGKNISIIEHYNLNGFEILMIVKEWYSNGYFTDILQDEQGNDLEDILSNSIELME